MEIMIVGLVVALVVVTYLLYRLASPAGAQMKRSTGLACCCPSASACTWWSRCSSRRNSNDRARLVQVVVYLGVLVALAKPLGTFMAAVYEGRRTFLSPRAAGRSSAASIGLPVSTRSRRPAGSATRSACCS